MPRLLLVSETFPPDASVGAKRTRRMAAHLARLGWEVEVLTVTASSYDHLDPTLLDAAAPYRVIRTFAVTPMVWGRRLRNRLRGSPSAVPAGSGGRGAGAGEAGPAGGTLLGAGRALLTTPDEYAGWIPFAAAGALTSAGRPDLVLASGPPFSSHIAAGVIARLRRAPLVLDYRDPWTSWGGRSGRDSFLDRLQRRSESRVLGRATGLVATTKGICHSLRGLRSLPCRVVPNAYDLDQMSGIEPMAYPRFTIVYTGSFYPGRDPDAILRALTWLGERGMLPERGLELRVIGATPGDVSTALAGTGLHEHIVLEGLLPYREALRRVAGADVVLLVVGRSHAAMVPAKLFDYLAAGRFVLGIGPVDSEAAEILKATGAGVMLDPADVAGIAAALQARFREPRGAGVPPDRSGSYEAGTTMRDLDRFLRDILDGAPARRAAGA